MVNQVITSIMVNQVITSIMVNQLITSIMVNQLITSIMVNQVNTSIMMNQLITGLNILILNPTHLDSGPTTKSLNQLTINLDKVSQVFLQIQI